MAERVLLEDLSFQFLLLAVVVVVVVAAGLVFRPSFFPVSSHRLLTPHTLLPAAPQLLGLQFFSNMTPPVPHASTPSSSSSSSTDSGGVVVSISANYDGGNIEYVSQQLNRHDPTLLDVFVKFCPDPFTELEDCCHGQYFSFRSAVRRTTTPTATPATATSATAERETGGEVHQNTHRVRYVIVNAHEASYPEAWPGTTICYTTTHNNIDDPDSWKRNRDTYYTEGQLHWEHTHTWGGVPDGEEEEEDVTYFAYFPPYSESRRNQFLDTLLTYRPNDVQVLSLGQSLQGRNIWCVQLGTGSLVAWIIHRQHPGETMAEHYAEGLLQKLLHLPIERNATATATATVDVKEPLYPDPNEVDDVVVVEAVLRQYTLYVVPCMCPDGAALGHLRTNAVGANLNREWAPSSIRTSDQTTNTTPYDAPTLHRSPEVYCVLQKMQQTGCDAFVDVHGDEELPFNFTMGANLVPNWSPRLEALLGAFTASYARINSDMQLPYGYPIPDSPEQARKYMNVATNQITDRFDCLAVTIEMPFKDCQSNPDPTRGWTPARSRQLGASLVNVLHYVHPHLRGNTWIELPPEDAYVPTTDDYGQDRGPSHGGDSGKNDDNDNDDDERHFQMLKKRMYSDVHEIHKHHHTNAAAAAPRGAGVEALAGLGPSS